MRVQNHTHRSCPNKPPWGLCPLAAILFRFPRTVSLGLGGEESWILVFCSSKRIRSRAGKVATEGDSRISLLLECEYNFAIRFRKALYIDCTTVNSAALQRCLMVVYINRPAPLHIDFLAGKTHSDWSSIHFRDMFSVFHSVSRYILVPELYFLTEANAGEKIREKLERRQETTGTCVRRLLTATVLHLSDLFAKATGLCLSSLNMGHITHTQRDAHIIYTESYMYRCIYMYVYPCMYVYIHICVCICIYI